MSFTKSSYHGLVVIIIAILLSACGSAPVQEGGDGTINPNARVVDVPDAARSDYQDVLKAIDNKSWSTAQNLLEKMQATYPDLLSVKTMLGWVYWQSGNIEKAEAQLEPVTQTRGLYKSDAFNYLAIIYREQGKFSEAEAVYKNAIGIWPRDSVLYKNLGILYELYFGRLKDALASYKQAQSFNSSDKQLNGWIKDLERRVK